MKSEIWFEEKALEMAKILGRPNMIEPELEFIKRIYTEGRRDQNLADMEAVTHGRTSYCGHIADIRAAGPGENE